MFFKIFFSILFITLFSNSNLLFSKYLDSKSCEECHPTIYNEHTKSMHHNSTIYKDELHAKMKEKVSPRKYSCALCHTPMTTDLRALMKGKKQPNEFNKRQNDGVSCFYCHQISKVIYTKHKGINFSSYKEVGKPTFFGNLPNPEDSDKHKSNSTNNIYSNNQVCMGCHAYKKNNNEIEVCNTLNELDKTSDCISCHMTKKEGPPTKLNAKVREGHTSHEFLGIHSKQMVKKAVKLGLKQLDNQTIELTIKNRMGHSIITQPMRLKYVKTTVLREGKVIFKNFKNSPLEDKKASFFIIFKDKNDKVTYPGFAKGYKYYSNLKAKQNKTIQYTIKELKKGDIIKSVWVSYIVAPKIAKKLKIEDKKIQKAMFGHSISITIK